MLILECNTLLQLSIFRVYYHFFKRSHRKFFSGTECLRLGLTDELFKKGSSVIVLLQDSAQRDLLIPKGGIMKFKTVAEKLYKAFIKAGFNVGPLRDVTSNYLPAFRFSVEKRTNDTVNLSRYNGKNFVHVECDVEDSFKIDQILNDFKPEVHFVIYF